MMILQQKYVCKISSIYLEMSKISHIYRLGSLALFSKHLRNIHLFLLKWASTSSSSLSPTALQSLSLSLKHTSLFVSPSLCAPFLLCNCIQTFCHIHSASELSPCPRTSRPLWLPRSLVLCFTINLCFNQCAGPCTEHKTYITVYNFLFMPNCMNQTTNWF